MTGKKKDPIHEWDLLNLMWPCKKELACTVAEYVTHFNEIHPDDNE